MEDRIQLYIDKENVKSFVKSRDNDDFDDCVRLIKRNIDVHYNFPKDEIKKDLYIQAWFQIVQGHGVRNISEYSKDNADVIPNRPFSVNDFYPDGNEDIFGIYLINEIGTCQSIRDRHCVLIGKVGEEIDILKQLLEIDEGDEYFLKKTNWQKFCPKLPLTDIVLCDNYYFKSREDYTYNKNELLRVLSSVPNQFPINVTIITQNEHVDSRFKMDEVLDNLQEMVEDASGNKDSAVTIVLVKGEVHDRALITNYYRINSTGGFQKQRGTKDDVRVDIRSHTKGKNFERSMELIKIYKRAVQRSPYWGAKRSNFDLFE